MPNRTKKRRSTAAGADDDDGSPPDDVPANTQRRGRRKTQQAHDDSDEDAGPATQNGGAGDTLQSLVRKLVRYAVACEYSRQKIRREGIREKVLGPHGRAAPFKHVFDGAQKELRAKFGMQMVELPSVEKVTIHEKRAAAQRTQSLPAGASTNTWILVSTLPAAYRTAAIMPTSRVPTEWQEATYVGLYTTVIALIALAGGTLSEPRLERYLMRLNAEANTPLDSTARTLARMLKDGYLVKTREPNPNGQDELTEWRVGPRGKMEVGTHGVKGLVMHVYGDAAADDLENRIQSSLGLPLARQADERDEGEDEREE